MNQSTRKRAREAAATEGLQLVVVASNATGFKNIYLKSACRQRPYQLQVWQDGKDNRAAL